jgi:CRP/FNR family transcriptional regulator
METRMKLEGKGSKQYRTDTALAPKVIDAWKEIDLLTSPNVYPAEIELFQQGTTAQDVYFIKQGIVKLIYLHQDGKKVIIGLKYSLSALGASSVILGERYPFTAVTMTPCQIYRIRANDFFRLLQNNEELSLFIHKAHSHEIYDQVSHCTELVCCSARQRLEHFLWKLTWASDRKDVDREFRLRLPLKNSEIAQLIGVTKEYLSSLIKELEQDNLVRRDKGWLIICEPHNLWHSNDS